MKYKNIEEIDKKCKEFEQKAEEEDSCCLSWDEISNLLSIKNKFIEATANNNVYIMTKELCRLIGIYNSLTHIKFGNPNENLNQYKKYITDKYHLINIFYQAYGEIEKQYCQHALIGDFDIRQSFLVNPMLVDWGYYNRNLKSYVAAIREARKVYPDPKADQMEKYYKEDDREDFNDLCVVTYTYPNRVIAAFKTSEDAIAWQIYPDCPEKIDGEYWADQPVY